MTKKPATWLGGEFASMALAPIMFVLGILFWPIVNSNLWDLVLLTFGLPVGIALCRRVGIWPLLGFTVLVLWAVDLWAYSVSQPLSDPIWSPFANWTHIASMRNLSWILRTLGLITFVIMLVSAVRGRKLFLGLVAGLMCCTMLGSGPAYLSRTNRGLSIQRMDADTYVRSVIDSLMVSQPASQIEVDVTKDDSPGYPAIMASDGQIVIVKFDYEVEGFWLVNLAEWKAAKANPAYVRGTFESPCIMTAGILPDTYPLAPRLWGQLPLSVNAVRVGGGMYAPVEQSVEVYQALRDGAVTMTYNCPQGVGGNSHVRRTAYGRRVFRVWVLDVHLYQETLAQVAL